MDIVTLGWWLIIIAVRIIYFIYLVGRTADDAGFGQNPGNPATEHYDDIKWFRKSLLIAGGLWLWSHLEFFSVLCIASLIAVVIFDPEFGGQDSAGDTSNSRAGNSELYSNIYLGIRCVLGVIWMWSHKKLLFYASIFAFVVYVIVIAFRDTEFRRDTRDAPVCAQGVHLVSNGDEEDSASDGSVRVETMRSSWRAMVGQNVNVGGGIQTIGGVQIGDFGIQIEVNRCRDVIIRSLRGVRYRN